MNLIEIVVDKTHSQADIAKIFEQRGLKRGDEVRVISHQELDTFLATAVAFAVALGVIWYLNKKNQAKQITDKTLDELFGKYASIEELEKHIESEYGIIYTANHHIADEDDVWRVQANTSLLKAYSDAEPEYFLADIKEPNSLYKSK